MTTKKQLKFDNDSDLCCFISIVLLVLMISLLIGLVWVLISHEGFNPDNEGNYI